jgi:hypothetical protein
MREREGEREKKKKKKTVATFPQSDRKMVETKVQSMPITTAHFPGLYSPFYRKNMTGSS